MRHPELDVPIKLGSSANDITVIVYSLLYRSKGKCVARRYMDEVKRLGDDIDAVKRVTSGWVQIRFY